MLFQFRPVPLRSYYFQSHISTWNRFSPRNFLSEQEIACLGKAPKSRTSYGHSIITFVRVAKSRRVGVYRLQVPCVCLFSITRTRLVNIKFSINMNNFRILEKFVFCSELYHDISLKCSPADQ